MLRLLIQAMGFGVMMAACATTGSTAGVTRTTSGAPHACFTEDAACANNDDCCSSRCDNGECVRQEP